MNIPTNKPIASLIAGLAAASFMAASVMAATPDAEVKLPATSLYVNQEFVITISSKVFCKVQTGAMGLDDPTFKVFDEDDGVFNPPRQYKYKFAKAGKYRMYATFDDNYCGNMKNTNSMTDIVVKPAIPLPPMVTIPTLKPVTVPNPKPATKPVTKPCAKKGNQQLDPACIDN